MQTPAARPHQTSVHGSALTPGLTREAYAVMIVAGPEQQACGHQANFTLPVEVSAIDLHP